MENYLSSGLKEKLDRLCYWLSLQPCVLAFSGGVDSSMLAKAMSFVEENNLYSLAIRPIGYFAESSSSTALERAEARRIAREVGVELRVLQSDEFSDPRFVANSPMRCYWCKKIRFEAIKRLANEEFSATVGREVIVIDGSNADDKNDYRPGSQAAKEVGVKSPLMEAGFTKADVRALAQYWGLSVAQKPSNPCLATRVAYSLPLSDPILRQVEAAELELKGVLGVDVCRARIDAPGVVRIEVPEEWIEKVASASVRSVLVERMRKIGFNFVALDLEGFYSGKNNRSIKQ